MGHCTALDGSTLHDEQVKGLILGDNLLMAIHTVSRFITKRNMVNIHNNIITHVVKYQKTMDLAPRGFGKSTIGDVDYCITRILRDPNIRIMIGSKTQGQSEAFLGEIRTHFELNDDLIRIFGVYKSPKWNNNEITVSKRTVIKKEGTLTALGASGAVVSKHFDLIIGDDLVGFENARTEGQRTKLKDWFYSSLLPTLEPDGEIHIIGTRYHPLDLYQDFIESGNYNIQTQPAIKVVDGEQESLWEEKFSLALLQKLREESGSIIFGMQYQNDVELAKGNIFKAKDFRYYDEYKNEGGQVKVFIRGHGEVIDRWIPVKVYMGSDLAISQSNSADYFVLMVIGIDKDNNIYVLEYVQEKLSFDKQFNKIMVYSLDKFPMVERIGVESVGYQMSLVQELRRNSTLPIIDIHTSSDKGFRMMKRSALFENHKVFFRQGMTGLENELLLFPEAEHDDLCDGLDFAMSTAESTNSVRVLDRSMFRI